MFTTFYNETIRKTVVAFGAVCLMKFLLLEKTQNETLQKNYGSDFIRSKRKIHSHVE